ncbi:hypothetical protein ACXZ1K_10140 [Pedobacter sp. PWIIR3]
MAKEKSKDYLSKHPELKIDDTLNLGLDADQSSTGDSDCYNNDNDQVSGNGDAKVYSPLDDK